MSIESYLEAAMSDSGQTETYELPPIEEIRAANVAEFKRRGREIDRLNRELTTVRNYAKRLQDMLAAERSWRIRVMDV